MQKTDRQVEELVAFAKSNRLNFDESTDIYKDIISGVKDGEDRPNFSILIDEKKTCIRLRFSQKAPMLPEMVSVLTRLRHLPPS